MPPACANTWTAARIALPTQLWAYGYSASVIGSRLGGVSRLAVIGKVHRLGLSGRATTISRTRVRGHRRRRPHNNGDHHQAAKRCAAESAARGLNQAGPDLFRPVSEIVANINLEHHHCRWLYGDNPFLHRAL